MKNYTVEQFLEDVRKEAAAIKELATPQEIANLNFVDLVPQRSDECIYGQMTGNCRSKRAAFLIYNSCPRYFVNTGQITGSELHRAISAVNGEKIQGVDSAELLYDDRHGWVNHFSAIETYILTYGAKNENLIAYLKGETETLEL